MTIDKLTFCFIPVSSKQGYTLGKSVATALRSLISRLEKSLHFKEYTLVIFLHI